MSRGRDAGIWQAQLGLSPTLKLPVIYMREADRSDSGYADLTIPQYLRFRRNLRGWSFEREGELLLGEHLGETLILKRHNAFLSVAEWQDWERCYLPEGGLGGQSVLDVGAGCGETAHFAFSKGAKHVTAVEIEMESFELLRRNARANRWDLTAINEPFRVEHLLGGYDFVKMDIEGGEAALLEVEKLPRTGLEVHSKELMRRFKDRGFRVVSRSRRGTWLMQS